MHIFCAGTNGTNGTKGTNDAIGTNGTNGINGTNPDTNSTNDTNGTNGVHGTIGTNGTKKCDLSVVASFARVSGFFQTREVFSLSHSRVRDGSASSDGEQRPGSSRRDCLPSRDRERKAVHRRQLDRAFHVDTHLRVFSIFTMSSAPTTGSYHRSCKQTPAQTGSNIERGKQKRTEGARSLTLSHSHSLSLSLSFCFSLSLGAYCT